MTGKMETQTKDVAGIILAAGRSSRMGSNKMLLPIGGVPIIEHCVKSIFTVCRRVVVVLGDRADLFLNVRNAYPDVEFVVNEDPDQGMFNSLLTGLRIVQESKAMILPGDCPLVPQWVYQALLTCHGCSVPTYHGLPGHPVMVDRTAIDGMLHSKPGSLRQYLFENGFKTLNIDDDRILIDIDDKATYQEACVQYDLHCQRES